MSFFIKCCFLIFLSLPVYAQQTAPSFKKNSVEDIFIWKMSDELNLTAKEEKKFSEIHRDLNKQKIILASKLQKLSYFSKDTPNLSNKQILETIKDYKKTLVSYNNLSLQELEKMKLLLGDKKFLQYLAIKQDINLKLKSLIVGESSEKKNHVKLPPPQIIEEK